MRFFNRITALLICIALMSSLFSLNTFAANDIGNANNTNEEISTSNEYNNYISSFSYADASDNLTSHLLSTDAETALIGEKNAAILKTGKSAVFEVDVPEDAAYNITITLGDIKESTEEYRISLSLDGSIPFADSDNITLYSLFADQSDIRKLPSGDEIAPTQAHYKDTFNCTLNDSQGIELYPYKFMLSKGIHTFTVKSLENDFNIFALTLTAPEKILSYEKVSENYTKYENYTGEQVTIEGENSFYRNSVSLSPKSDRTNASVSPSNPKNSVVNYIGGDSWSNPGSTITWSVKVPENGLYKIGFSFLQNFVTNGATFRWLKIDGQTPFAEAEKISFEYGGSWQYKEFSNGENPYLIYLTKGKHEISLTATLADTSEILRRLGKVVEDLGNLYLEILMITGESPDANRDYELHKQIPEFIDILKSSNEELKSLNEDMSENLSVNGEVSGALRNMIRIIDDMTNNLYEAHTQVPSFSSAQQTLSAWLYDMRQMPLSIDQIILGNPEDEFKTPQASFFEKLKFSLKRFIFAYTRDYTATENTDSSNKQSIKIWVNWGRDQVKILSNLIYSDFMDKHNINVELEQVNATLVQGVISGNSPDLYLHLSRSQPVNLAMRGVLYNLENFDDFDSVISTNFKKGSETPYLYKGGCYALPDLQQFNVMFYREDIFNKLGLKVPDTWDEFIQVTAILQRNKMNVYLPYTKLEATSTVNVGVGGLTIFPTFLMQSGGSLYNKKQNETLLSGNTAVKAFTKWTDFYTRYGLDPQANFYNKFRAGVYPMGVTNYTTCFTISAGAPEIEGKWKIAQIPGTVDENGNLNRVCAGSGSGCAIMKNSDNKEAAWEFLKWWVSEDIQYRYSRDVEAVLGETARISSANPHAVSRLSWKPEMLDVILKQWDNVTEVAEVPGSYYVARSIDQAFWATKNKTDSPREAMLQWADVSNREIQRKIEEYSK